MGKKRSTRDMLFNKVDARMNFLKSTKAHKRTKQDKAASFDTIKAKNRAHPL